MNKVIEGRVVNVISEEGKDVRIVVKTGNSKMKQVDVPVEIYEKAITDNKGTIWGSDVEISIGKTISLKVEN